MRGGCSGLPSKKDARKHALFFYPGVLMILCGVGCALALVAGTLSFLWTSDVHYLAVFAGIVGKLLVIALGLFAYLILFLIIATWRKM